MGILDYFKSQTPISPEEAQALAAGSASGETYLTPRMASDAAAGIASIPLVPAQAGLLASQVGTALYRQLPDGQVKDVDAPADAPTPSFLQSFTNAPYSQDPVDIKKAVTDARAADPSGDEASITAAARKNLMGPVRRFVGDTEEGIQKAVGAPTGEDRDVGDEVISGLAQASIPSPFSIASKLPGVFGKAASIAGHMSANVENPATIGGLVNAGVMAGLPPVVNYALDQDNHTSILDEAHPAQDLVTSNPLPTVDDHVNVSDQSSALASDLFAQTSAGPGIPTMLAILGLGLSAKDPEAMAAALKGVAKGMGHGAEDAVEQAVKQSGKGFVDGGKGVDSGSDATTLAGMVQDLDLQTSRKITNALDEMAPVHDAMRDAGATYQEAVTARNTLTNNWRTNISEKVSAARSMGQLPGMDQPTISVDQLRMAKQAAQDSGFYDDWSLRRLAQTQLDTRGNQLKDAEQAVQDANIAWNKAQTSANSRTMREALDKVEAVRNDAPELRQAMPDYSTDDLKQLIAKGDDHQGMQQLDAMHDKLYSDLIEMRRQNGLITDADVAEIKARNPHYSPQYLDPNEGATGVRRWLKVAERKLGRTDNPLGDPGGPSTFDPLRTRQDAEIQTPEDKSRYFMDPTDAADLKMEREVRSVGKETMTRDTVDSIRSFDAGNTQAELVDWNGRTSLRVDEIRGIKSDNPRAFDNLLPVNRDGKYEFYKMKDPRIAPLLAQAPAVSIPLLRSINATFRKFTTGSLRPAFAPKNFMYDTTMLAGMRPLDSVYGTDFIAAKAMQATGIPYESAFAHVALKGARAFDAGTLYAVPYALNTARAVKLFFDQNNIALAKSLSHHMAADPTFASFLGVGGKGVLEKYSQIVLDAYKEGMVDASNPLTSWAPKKMGDIVAGNVSSFRAIESVTGVQRDFDKFITEKMPLTGIVTSPIHLAFEELQMAMSSMHSAARVGYAMRNAEMLRWRFGDNVPKDALNKVLTDARTLTGDFSVLPGSDALKYAFSISPYNNIQLRSIQTIFQRMSNPAVAGYVVAGAVMPQLYAYNWFSNHAGPDGYNWYFHQIPVWQRVSTVIVPSAQLLYRYAVQGERNIKFDEKDYYKISMAQEFRPIAFAGAEAIRALGLGIHNQFGINKIGPISLNMAQNDPMSGVSMQNAAQLMKEATGSAIAPNLPSFVTAAAGAAGVKIDTGNVFGGENPFSVQPGQGRPGGDMMNINSGVPRSIAGFVSGTLGALGSTMTDAFDTGIQNYKGDGTFDKILNAVMAGGKEVYQQQAYNTNITPPISSDIAPGAPFIGRGMEKIYRGGPIEESIKNTKQTIMTASKLQPPPDYATNPQSKLVYDISMAIKQIGSSDGVKGYSQQLSEYGRDLAQNSGNKQVDYVQRTQDRKTILLKMQSVQQSLSQLYDQYATQLRKTPQGQAFQQMTGKPFSFKDFGEMLPDAVRSGQAAPIQRRYTASPLQ